MDSDGNVKRERVDVGQLPRYSRPICIYMNNVDAEYMEPVNSWNHNLCVLKELREEEEKLFQKCLTFSELCSIINESKNEVILKNLSMLYGITQELSKDEQPEILSSTVVYFFKLLIDVPGLLMKHILELRSMFGKVSNNTADQIFKLVKEVEQLMDDKSINQLKLLWEKLDSQKITNEKTDENSVVNGKLPHYKQNPKLTKCWVPPNFAKLPVYNDDSKKSSKSFSMAYNEEEKRSSPKFGKTWLLKQIALTSSVNLGVSDEDYYNSIIDMLSSQKSNIELQDEICKRKKSRYKNYIKD